MPTFGQRYGYEPAELPFQREVVDERLRTKLWNILSVALWDAWEAPNEWRNRPDIAAKIEQLTKRLWVHFLHKQLDELPTFRRVYNRPGAYDVMKEYFFSCPWYRVYSFLEELAQDQSKLLTKETREWINEELEGHNAAYRFVGTQIAEITSAEEIAAIRAAQGSAPDPVRVHLQEALRLLSDREHPNYRNSIKESISAVESACRLVTGMPKATLSDALKRVPGLHPALALGFDKIYGYTSDQQGIRHSLVDQPSNTYAEAKFMLVACSAFVSYLQSAAKAS